MRATGNAFPALVLTTGAQVRSLMRKSNVTIRELASRTDITMKRIREVRNYGITDPFMVRDWVQAITGADPGPWHPRES